MDLVKGFFAFLFVMGLQPVAAFAQGASGGQDDKMMGSDAIYEAGFHVGNLLPNQIGGVTEIMGLGGVRMGFRMSPLSYVETGFIAGNGDGQQWKNLNLGVRMDIPVQNLVFFGSIGADSVLYRGEGTSDRLIFGGSVGAGIQTHLSSATWFRTDMKFGFSPGTSLYFGFGLVWRLGGSS